MKLRYRGVQGYLFIACLWMALLPGQVFRIEIGKSSGGINVLDIVVLGFVVGSLLILKRNRSEITKFPQVRLLGVWVATLILSFLVGASHYTVIENISAFGYLARLVMVLTIFPIIFARNNELADMQKSYLVYAVVTTLGLLILGGVILIAMPNFASLTLFGWDPHIGRLTSTWLDPNYFGSYLSIVFAAALSWEDRLYSDRKSWALLLVFLAILILGIYMTVSRSAIVTLAVAALIASMRTSWRAVVIAIASVALLLMIPGRLQDRISSSVEFTQQISSENSGSIDPSAKERTYSWIRAVTLFKESPVYGVGYNFYQPALIKYGLLDELGVTRGTKASDSSLLTLLATTGIIGVIAAAIFWLRLVYLFLRNKGAWSTMALASLGGIAIGSQLNNLLLYPLLLVPLTVLVALAYLTYDK